jgi:class 3 adenylate cyclase/tetratricopeptide (TPR) repeat protein
MQCQQCQYTPPADAAFCPACGSKLAIRCGQCRTANAADHKFCKQCGQPLVLATVQAPATTTGVSPRAYTPKYLAEKILTSRSTLEGERKEVTVFFCDVVDSTCLAERLGPEVMHRLMDRTLRLMADIVHRYEGTVNQYLGDGLMALFGAPLALEDHALRAALTALTVQEALSGANEELGREHGVALRLRMGLNTGLVVVGRIGDDLRMDYTAVGDTTNVAARMQSLAAPGAILMTASTHRLVEEYIDNEALGPVQVKGRREPILVYRVTGRRQRSRLEVNLERGLTPLVGRKRELTLLRDCLARVRSGRGQVVGIVGEAGAGKSRLLYEWRKVLAAEGIDWLEGHCVAYGHNTPYLPLLEVVRTRLHLEEGEPPLLMQEKLRRGLRQLDFPLEEGLPLLGELFGLPAAEVSPTHLPSHLKQWKTFEMLRALMVAGSQHRPHVLVLEDLHWIDQTSEAYLTFLIESLAGLPVLLITTHRPGYAARWAAKSYYTHMTLDLLGQQDAEELLRALLGADASLAPVKALLLERSEGNPFFLEESVRMLVESQVLGGSRGAYCLRKPFLTIQVPATVQTVLAARIDRLPPEEKDLLQIAAVIGRRFPLVLLQAVTEQPAETLRRTLVHLQAAEFVHETSLFPEVQYAFAHALTHDVAYGSLLQERRRALHARTVEAIERLYAERLAEWADQLAHHVVRGEVWSKATKYFRQGLHMGSPSMATSFWWMGEHDRAIELGQHDFTAIVGFKNFPGHVMVNFHLGQAYHALGDYPRAIDCLRWNVASLEDDLLQECFDLPGFASVLSRAWLAWSLSECGEFIEGMALAEEAGEIAESAAHPYSRSIACLGLGHLHLQRGELPQAITAFEGGLSWNQDADCAELFPLLAAPLGSAYALSVQIPVALPLLEQAVERATALHCLGLQTRRISRLGEAQLLAGRRDEAMVLARRALDLARAHKEQGHEAWALRLLGEIALHGTPPEVEQAEVAYRQAMALAKERRMRPLLAHCHLGLGTLYSRTGQARQAGAELSAATHLYQTLEMRFWLSRAETVLAHG